MAERPAVGVRYCGGCNPRYDRVAAVRELQERFRCLNLQPGGPGQRLTLVVCGCSARCAQTGDLAGPLVWICGRRDLEAAARRIADTYL